MSKPVTASRHAKGPFRAQVYGYRFGGGPSAKVETVTAARAFAESFRDEAKSCGIFDRHGRLVAQHKRTDSGWARA